MERRDKKMTQMENKQLEKTYGGGIGIGIALTVVAGVIFIIGVIDGYFRPLKCN